MGTLGARASHLSGALCMCQCCLVPSSENPEIVSSDLGSLIFSTVRCARNV